MYWMNVFVNESILIKKDFFKVLGEEWRKIPQATLAILVDSVPSRCAAVPVVKAKGYATKY